MTNAIREPGSGEPRGPNEEVTPMDAEPGAGTANDPATRATSPTVDRERMTVYLPGEVAGQARAVMLQLPPAVHGYRSLSDLVADAVDRRVEQLQREHNNGQPWAPAPPGTIRRGRPRA